MDLSRWSGNPQEKTIHSYLFLTNSPQLIPKVAVIPGLSDHCIPYCKFSVNLQKQKQVARQIPLYAKADWDGLRKAAAELSSNMQERLETATTEELWEAFQVGLNSTVKAFVPVSGWEGLDLHLLT